METTQAPERLRQPETVDHHTTQETGQRLGSAALEASQAREAFWRVIVDGQTMTQSSLEAGYSKSWMSSWRLKRPGSFMSFYEKIVAEAQQAGETIINESPPSSGDSNQNRVAARIRTAIDEIVAGKSARQASREAGQGRGWLGQWSQNNPERFQELYAEAIEEADRDGRTVVNKTLPTVIIRPKADDDKIRAAIDEVVAGKSMRQVSREAGYEEAWLSGWKRDHPEYFAYLHQQAREKAARRVGRIAARKTVAEESL